jgi:transcriptional regulator with XRE-family HTH domain
MRRMMLGMSQTTLGDALKITFQQIQKYERGTNRISASSLQQIANTLKVPVSFFFEDEFGKLDGKLGFDESSPTYVLEFLTTSDGLALVQSFMRIKDIKIRRSIVKLVEQIAGD